ncbi:hypothetical protein [Pelagimonas varians]|uniref:Phage terminase, small subunit n=1 Tax=Pelagimonas varians TaxID=696760 RepID=A0A238K9D1_9RHOB|nr:hypothetical protein [Pelagimonas varians]PYG31731.1 hypothetical protein C8N36_104151 [Pelagimonas varians]SMX38692.1 hypothetical protein PEV8663_01493 [Pelagimonas varians]
MAKQNQLDRHRELANSVSPEPPADYARTWTKKHHTIWREYASGKAGVDYLPSDLRLLAQAVDLELPILECMKDIRLNGATLQTPAGSIITNPSLLALQKMSSLQNNLLRRIGISVDGTSRARDISKNAKSAYKTTAAEADSKSDNNDQLLM